MSEPGTRPGGLTALAVINFVFAGLGLLMSAGVFLGDTLVSMGLEAAEKDAAKRAEMDRQAETRGEASRSAEEVAKGAKELEDMREAKRVYAEHGTILMVAGVVGILLALLQIVSGVGYLKLRRGLGKNVGTVYALGAIAWEIAGIALADKFGEGRSFGLMNIIGFIYPLVTLFALHRIFKDDFVNP
jgi:hypothetical protein